MAPESAFVSHRYHPPTGAKVAHRIGTVECGQEAWQRITYEFQNTIVAVS